MRKLDAAKQVLPLPADPRVQLHVRHGLQRRFGRRIFTEREMRFTQQQITAQHQAVGGTGEGVDVKHAICLMEQLDNLPPGFQSQPGPGLLDGCLEAPG